jgi:hypothetical protein
MSADTAEASKYADSLVKTTDQMSAVTGDWQRSVRNSDALAFSNLAVRLNDYQDSLYKLAPIVKQSGPKAAREWAAKNSRLRFATPSVKIWSRSASTTATLLAGFTPELTKALTIPRRC